jgi:hypothetical protein
VQIIFLALTFFGDWILIMSVSTIISVMRKCGINSLPSFDWKMLLIPWEIVVAIIPVFVAIAQQLNSVILTASIVIACVTVLSILLQNLYLVDTLLSMGPETEVTSEVLEETPDAKMVQTVNFIKDPFHAQFVWNAHLYNDKKSVRHKV